MYFFEVHHKFVIKENWRNTCKLYNNKYMIASTQIANTEIFAFNDVQVLKIMSYKVLLTNRKDNRNC